MILFDVALACYLLLRALRSGMARRALTPIPIGQSSATSSALRPPAQRRKGIALFR